MGLDVTRLFNTRPNKDKVVSSDSDSDAQDYDPEKADFGGTLDGTAASTRKAQLNAEGHDDTRTHYRDISAGNKRRAFPIDDDEFMGGKYRGVKTSRAALGFQQPDKETKEYKGVELLFSKVQDEPGSLREQIRAFREEEDSMLELVAKKATTDSERGLHVKAQLNKWQNALDIRVRLQPLLTLAQRVPPTLEYAALTEGTSCSEDKQAVIVEAERLAFGLVKLCADASADMKDQNISSLEKVLVKYDAVQTPVWKESLDKWHQKVALTEVTGKKQLRVINQSLWGQVEVALRDRERLLKRAHTRRTDVKPIVGSPEAAVVFDDGDFFGTLVRSWIDTSAGAALSAGLVVRQVNSKQNDHVRKASKGRMIRYDVQDKLVNFMVPMRDPLAWTDERIDTFFASIFPVTNDAEQ
jgi:protein AATF/BFR2